MVRKGGLEREYTTPDGCVCEKMSGDEGVSTQGMWTEGRRGGDYMVGQAPMVTAAIAHHEITRRDWAHDADATFAHQL